MSRGEKRYIVSFRADSLTRAISQFRRKKLTMPGVVSLTA